MNIFISISMNRVFRTTLGIRDSLIHQSKGGYKFYNANKLFTRRYTVLRNEIVHRNLMYNSVWSRKIHPCPLGVKQFNSLTAGERLVAPSFWQLIKSKLFIHHTLPLFDSDFSPNEFYDHASEALRIITKILSRGWMSDLEEVFSDKCLTEVRNNVEKLSAEDREKIAVKGLIYGLIIDGRFINYTVETTSPGENSDRSALLKFIYYTTECDENGLSKLYNISFLKRYAKDKVSPWIIDEINVFYARLQII